MNAVVRISYVKRYKMEVDLHQLPVPELPPGYDWVSWSWDLIPFHSEALFESFQGEIDAHVFPSLGERMGCQCLMQEISRKSGFVPQATWLLRGPGGSVCGTIQGIRERTGLGAIQNLGVHPAHRGRGLGAALLLKALHGFYQIGLGRALLEVTAQNDCAVRLYRRLGFRRCKTLYKAIPGPVTDAV